VDRPSLEDVYLRLTAEADAPDVPDAQAETGHLEETDHLKEKSTG